MQDFHPAVDLLTSSTGGSIHIARFKDEEYFELFAKRFLERNAKRRHSSLEFCHLTTDEGREEVLLIHNHPRELHFHGGIANVENFKKLCHLIPTSKEQTPKSIYQSWVELYRHVMAENSINYLLRLKERAFNNDPTLLKDESNYDLEGYQYLEPVSIMLIGPPNAGKSTLFNYLVGEQRALISDIEGTTRDSLSASLTFGGHEVLLIDSAGLREEILYRGLPQSDHSIQTQSENLVLQMAASSDLFCVFNSPHTPEWIPQTKVIHLQSKSEFAPPAHQNAISFSIHQNKGCEELIQAITHRVKTLRSGKISSHFIQPNS